MESPITMWSYLCDKCAGNSLRILLWLVGCGGLGNVVSALSADYVSSSFSNSSCLVLIILISPLMAFSWITFKSSLISLIYLDCRVTLSFMAFSLVSNFICIVSCTLFIFSVISSAVFSSCFLKNVSKLLADFWTLKLCFS